MTNHRVLATLAMLQAVSVPSEVVASLRFSPPYDWIAAVALAAWMEDAGRPGPLEQVMRRAVHGRRPVPQAR